MDYRNLLMRLFWHEHEMLGYCDINESIEEPSRAAFTEDEKAEVRKLRDEAFSEWLCSSHGDRAIAAVTGEILAEPSERSPTSVGEER